MKALYVDLKQFICEILQTRQEFPRVAEIQTYAWEKYHYHLAVEEIEDIIMK